LTNQSSLLICLGLIDVRLRPKGEADEAGRLQALPVAEATVQKHLPYILAHKLKNFPQIFALEVRGSTYMGVIKIFFADG